MRAALFLLASATPIFTANEPAQSKQEISAPAKAGCELHVWPTRELGAIVHGAHAGPVVGSIAMYLSPMDGVRDEMRRALGPETQSQLIAAANLPPKSPLTGYKIILHEAPQKSRFANFIDKHVGDGPREVDTGSSCHAELHLVALTTYRTALYAQLQTIYVFRNFGSSTQPLNVVRDAARTAPPKRNDMKDEGAADARLRASFVDAMVKILGNPKLGRR